MEKKKKKVNAPGTDSHCCRRDVRLEATAWLAHIHIFYYINWRTKVFPLERSYRVNTYYHVSALALTASEFVIIAWFRCMNFPHECQRLVRKRMINEWAWKLVICYWRVDTKYSLKNIIGKLYETVSRLISQ